jgi:hypothetical protein
MIHCKLHPLGRKLDQSGIMIILIFVGCELGCIENIDGAELQTLKQREPLHDVQCLAIPKSVFRWELSTLRIILHRLCMGKRIAFALTLFGCTGC